MKKLLWSVICLLSVSLCALAGSDLQPKGAAGFAYAGEHDYEGKSPGLGFSIRFVSENGWADEYHYDMGETWPDKPSEKLKNHFEGNIGDVFKAKQLGYYKTATLVKSDTETLDGLKFYHASLKIQRSDDSEIESHIYLTAFKGKLVKYRLSLNEPVSEQSRKEAAEFISFRVAELKAGRR